MNIPIGGNAFVTVKSKDAVEVITNRTLGNWTNPNSVASIYFRVFVTGSLCIGLRASVPSGSSVIKVTVPGNEPRTVSISGGQEWTHYVVGDFIISNPGYIKLDLQGISKTGNYFADVSDITCCGPAAQDMLFCDDPAFYYWSRRGPSCHLNYRVPSNVDINYYYNEVTIPHGADVVGSYFMAIGFNEGYFGIQVNSDTERRILFSVWSPYQTDDPNSIPDDYRITLNRAGQGVAVGQFGNEGSGGQSYCQYQWVAGQAYKFLLRGEPDRAGNTDYTAWFRSPDMKTWMLIASWKRPYTNTYLQSFHSFVENFECIYGYLSRKAEYKNQWVHDTSGEWHVITSASFSVDETYRRRQRIDAIGGVNACNDGFFLRNGGFFSDAVAPNTLFNCSAPHNQPPAIDFSELP